MPRKPRDQLFKKSDVYRLVEVARAKNLSVSRIVVTREGLSLVVGETEEAKVDHSVVTTLEDYKAFAP